LGSQECNFLIPDLGIEKSVPGLHLLIPGLDELIRINQGCGMNV